MGIRLAIAAVAALTLGVAAAPIALSQQGITIAIDVDVSGNDARTVATIQNCGRIDSGGELEIDIVLPDPGIASTVGIQAYQFKLLYDPDILTVTAEDQNFLVNQASGSILIPLSDFLPDNDGAFLSATADRSEEYQVEPQGSYEVGPGVITRLTLSAVAKGKTDLTFDEVILVDVNKDVIPLGTIAGAAVSVDTSCTEPPPSTVLPTVSTPGAAQTPAAVQTPAAADSTPAPGTPSVDPDSGAGPNGEPADGQTPADSTPGPGTPVLGGTPVSGGEEGGDDVGQSAGDSDDGLSAGAWAGIGVGVTTAVLASAGAVWYGLRRGKAGSG